MIDSLLKIREETLWITSEQLMQKVNENVKKLLSNTCKFCNCDK